MKKAILFLAIALSANLTISAQFNAAEYLDINNVRARFMVHGDMFWNPATGMASYEFPKGSGKQSGFASSLWVGGIDQATNNLKVAAQTYRSSGVDYWPGPLDEFNGGVSDITTAGDWAQIWKVNKTTIDSFLSIGVHTLNNTPTSILTWPARKNPHAKTPLGATLQVPDRNMAPFVDVNNDNVYNALDGDYPDIKGEQMLWWVFNDNSAPHNVSQTDPLKIEVHASAYACNIPGLENTTFLNYRIYNWGSSILDSTVISFWNDIDLGYGFDDFIGFDSTHRMGIAYNGDSFDEQNTSIGYGSSLTQKAAVIIRQPGDSNNYLSPIGAITSFNNSTGVDGDPTIGSEFYYYMTGSWRDGMRFRKGCNLRDSLQPISNYVYPDDPSVIGGISEVECNKVPFDRRFLISSSPFQLVPGSTPLEYTFAFINTDTGVNNSNFNELRRLADSAYKYPDGCASVWPLSTKNLISEDHVKVYPNPTRSVFNVESNIIGTKEIQLYNAFGQLVSKKTTEAQKAKIDVSLFAKGVYYLRLSIKEKTYSQSILVH